MPDGAKKNRQRDKLGTQRKNEKDNVVVNNYLGKAIENQVTTVCNLVKQNSSCNPWGCKCYGISPFVLTRRNGQFNFLTTEFYPHPPSHTVGIQTTDDSFMGKMVYIDLWILNWSKQRDRKALPSTGAVSGLTAVKHRHQLVDSLLNSYSL